MPFYRLHACALYSRYARRVVINASRSRQETEGRGECRFGKETAAFSRVHAVRGERCYLQSPPDAYRNLSSGRLGTRAPVLKNQISSRRLRMGVLYGNTRRGFTARCHDSVWQNSIAGPQMPNPRFQRCGMYAQYAAFSTAAIAQVGNRQGGRSKKDASRIAGLEKSSRVRQNASHALSTLIWSSTHARMHPPEHDNSLYLCYIHRFQ